MPDPVTRTIRVRVRILSHSVNNTASTKKEAYTRFRDISTATYKGMNECMSTLMFVDQLRSKSVDIQKEKNKKELLSKNEKWDFEHPNFLDQNMVNEEYDAKFKEFFGCKSSNSPYRILCNNYGTTLPSSVMAPLSNAAFNKYSGERKDVAKGLKTISTFKRGFPVPITLKNLTITASPENEFEIKWLMQASASTKENMIFCPIFGKKNTMYRQDFQNITNGTLPVGTVASIQLKDTDLFILISVKDPIVSQDVNPDISVGVDLGLAIPAYCATSNTQDRLAIGSAEDFLRFRTQINKRARNLHKSLVLTKGGKGREKKLQALDRFSEYEKGFAKQYNHMVSKRIIDFAIKNKAGIIKLEFLKGFPKEHQDSFILRNWSYFQLQSDITYKARNAGIEVLFVDPYHTSQTCSFCGNYEEGQRPSQSQFICKKCGKTINADYNAARNIAKSEKVVDKEEQCEYYRIRSETKES